MDKELEWAAREAYDCSNLTMRLAIPREIYMDGFKRGVEWADSRRNPPDHITINGIEYVRLVPATPRHGLTPQAAAEPPATSPGHGPEGEQEPRHKVTTGSRR